MRNLIISIVLASSAPAFATAGFGSGIGNELMHVPQKIRVTGPTHPVLWSATPSGGRVYEQRSSVASSMGTAYRCCNNIPQVRRPGFDEWLPLYRAWQRKYNTTSSTHDAYIKAHFGGSRSSGGVATQSQASR